VSITTDLDAIRARTDAATAGPWHGEHAEFGYVTIGDWLPADAEFIAHARTDIPFLLDLVDELRRQVKVWKGKAS
jgi:hypothetical protein